MPDSLYVIDATAASLVPLPTTPAQVPTLTTYTIRNQAQIYSPTTLDQVFTNFSQPQAVLYISARVVSFGGGSGPISIDVLVNGTSILSQGTPTTLATSSSSFPLWTAGSTKPVVPAGGTLSVYATAGGAYGWAIDVCLVPVDQLPVLGSL